MSKITIYQFTDPTCIWCWGNEPVLRALDFLYGDKISIEFIMGGLVEDIRTLFNIEGTTTTIIEKANKAIADNWHKASLRHGMPISMERMTLYTEQYTSSFPQNIAYEAAKRIDKERAKLLLRRIREATFTENRRTSQINVLVELALEVGLDAAQFIDIYTYGAAQADFMQDRMKCRRNGITGFPSYLIHENNTNIILGGYQNLSTFHTVISRLSGGKIRPRRVGPSLANVMAFVKRYRNVYPVEIECAFSLDKPQTDIMVDELLRDQRLVAQAVGNGRKLMIAPTKKPQSVHKAPIPASSIFNKKGNNNESQPHSAKEDSSKQHNTTKNRDSQMAEYAATTEV